MNKKLLCALLMAALVFTLFPGCGSAAAHTGGARDPYHSGE